jgi:hypothetical protein
MWSNGRRGAIQDNLPAGTYTVTATETAACQTTLTVRIPANNENCCEGFTFQVSGQQDATCGEANGSVSLMPANFEYTWSDGGRGANRTDLAPGVYTVIGTNDGCSTSIQVTVGDDTSDCCDGVDFYVAINRPDTCCRSVGLLNSYLLQTSTLGMME